MLIISRINLQIFVLFLLFYLWRRDLFMIK